MGKDYVKERNDKKAEVLAKCFGRCAYCGCDLTVDSMQMDHIISKVLYRERSGMYRRIGIRENGIENLNPACVSCNDSKGICTIEQFRERLEVLVDNLRINNATFRIAEKYGLVSAEHKKIVFYFETLKVNG